MERQRSHQQLTLHIAESCLLYGPLSSFWCYGYERIVINKSKINMLKKITKAIFLIGKIPNSQQQVEVEVMRYLMNGMQVDQKIASMNNASLECCLSLLKKSSV